MNPPTPPPNQGVSYFECDEKCGVFVKPSQCTVLSNDDNESSDSAGVAEAEAEAQALQVWPGRDGCNKVPLPVVPPAPKNHPLLP